MEKQEELTAFWKAENRLYNETNQLYHRLARHSGLSDCAFWLLYALREAGFDMPLDALSVAVEGREVRILPARGFNRGNENLPFVEVELEVGEDAFRDEAGNSNEAMTLRFTAAAQRCGSSYLSGFMEDGCKCYSEGSKCYCDCGPVDLFEL